MGKNNSVPKQSSTKTCSKLPSLKTTIGALDHYNSQLKKQKPLPLSVNRSCATALFLLLKDIGIVQPSVGDYELAQFMEQHVLYSSSKKLKKIKIEISKLRRHEKNPKELEKHLKALFAAGKIKVIEDIKKESCSPKGN